jgi:hypothetical protein
VVLGAAAAVVAAVGSGRRERLVCTAAWSVAGVLLVRGAAYIPIDLIGGLETEYARLDLAIYSPLCLALALGAAIVARGPRPEYDAKQTHRVTGARLSSAKPEPRRRSGHSDRGARARSAAGGSVSVGSSS